MAAASATAGNKYQSSTGLLIVTYVGDVTKAQADGIVVSEGRSFRVMGYVATTLVSMDSEFDTNRNKLIQKEKANFTPWSVYTTGNCARFLSVFHAIVIPRGEKQPIQEWNWKMTSLYKKILQEAEKEGISILAVPLLGPGKGKVKPADAVEVAVRAMFSYKRTSLVKVLLVSDSEDIVDKLVIQCAYYSNTKGGKPLSQRPPPNIKTERPLPQPPSSNAKSKSKLGRGTDSSCSSLKRQNGDRSDSSINSDNNGTCGGGMELRSGRQLQPQPQSKGQPPCPTGNGNGKGKITTPKRNPSSGGRSDSRASHSGSGNSHVESEHSHRERRTLCDQDVQKENLKTRPERTLGGRNSHVGSGNSYSGGGYSHSRKSTLYDQGDAQEEEHDLKTRPEKTLGGRGNSYSGSGYSLSERSTWYDQGDAQEKERDLKTRPERTRGSELKRIKGQTGKAYYETEMGGHDEPKALQHRCDIRGGVIPKIKNKAQHNDKDGDENVVKQKRLAPQRRIYEEGDGDEINDDDEEEDTSEQEKNGGHVGGRIENQEQHRRELATTSTESATVSAHIPRPPSPEDEMKEQLSCPVCLDLFTDPVILQPCCHSLCSECAETIRSPKSSFKCPMCLAFVQNGPLQRNFHLKGTVSIYKRQRKISNSMN